MKDSPPFTDEERILISYYRNPALSSWRRTVATELVQLCVSLFFIVLFLAKDEVAWGVTGYLILVYLKVQNILESRRWQPAMRGIIEKYEARIEELGKARDAGPES